MSMFRKVFGNHMAGHNSDSALVPMVPMGGGVAQSATARAEEHTKCLEMVTPPRHPQSDSQNLKFPQNDEPAPDLAARAADAHRQIEETQTRPRFSEIPLDIAPATPDPILDAPPAIPAPIASSDVMSPKFARQSGGRTRTRLLGFDSGGDDVKDIFAGADIPAHKTKTFPTGWMVIASGPGQGHFFPLFAGVTMIGRGEDQTIRLDFGDAAISRQNHAAVAYDDEDNKFYLGHGGKSNIIRLNGRPVLATEELGHSDIIRIGETTLRFVALCGDSFTWSENRDGNA